MDERWVRVGKKVCLEILMMAIAFFGGMFIFAWNLCRSLFGFAKPHLDKAGSSPGPETPIKLSEWWKE